MKFWVFNFLFCFVLGLLSSGVVAEERLHFCMSFLMYDKTYDKSI